MASATVAEGSTAYVARCATVAAIGGFLMGFDASVVSGVVGAVEREFALSKIAVGWMVASLTLSATVAMSFAGPLSDRFGRVPMLRLAALLFAASSVACAFAQDLATLTAARMAGGVAVGVALIVAPVYIAEIAPPALRGRMVSINQLNIVVGISAAFLSNYAILALGQSDAPWATALRLREWNWRWMLGVEALPALAYLAALATIAESPRWLAMRGRLAEARAILVRIGGDRRAAAELAEIRALHAASEPSAAALRELWQPSMRLVLAIGLAVGVLQQITGINAVFFYAPLIFEQSGIGTNAAFVQAVFVGLVNVAFTVLAMVLIDRVGRRPLLGVGISGIAASMLLLAWCFGSATYTLRAGGVEALPPALDRAALAPLVDREFGSDIEFREAVSAAVGQVAYREHEAALVRAAISLDPRLVLGGILAFVASFAVSLGPVMWVLFSELFPLRLRGLAISFVGLVNSTVSFVVQLVFPWGLAHVGSAGTFLVFGVFAVLGLWIVMRLLPETRGRSLEELETTLVGH
jgi:sugar porter (SP) family MFS transporter